MEQNKCFNCVYCKQTSTCMKCRHKDKKIKGKNCDVLGRGDYCYPHIYDDCDCGGFKQKKQ